MQLFVILITQNYQGVPLAPNRGDASQMPYFIRLVCQKKHTWFLLIFVFISVNLLDINFLICNSRACRVREKTKGKRPFVCVFLYKSCLFGWFLNVLFNNYAISQTCHKTDVWQFYVLPHTRQSRETMTFVSAGHILMTPTQPVEEQAATAVIEPRTFLPGVARSTDWATALSPV